MIKYLVMRVTPFFDHSSFIPLYGLQIHKIILFRKLWL